MICHYYRNDSPGFAAAICPKKEKEVGVDGQMDGWTSKMSLPSCIVVISPKTQVACVCFVFFMIYILLTVDVIMAF